ncbi:hypothetical protein Tsubulata_038209 [Turnera subulata]|uniref:DUF8040 domain-containing protein n=1 Tax=Turnera subulata TaxID=218843 RepID=A0A9Q0JIM0_9ROSI|nr:hypothetical protein Tsubulata_038209 [Turnera subulata]
MDSSRKRSRTQFDGSTNSQENDTGSDNDSQSSVNQSQVGSNVIPTDPGPGIESSDYDTDVEESSDYDTESSYYETDDEDEDFLDKMLALLGKFADVSPLSIQRHQERKALRERTLSVFHAKREEIDRLTRDSNGQCIEAFKMDMNAFAALCELLRTVGGLVAKGQVGIEEQVATFVHTLAHPGDNRFLQDGFGNFDTAYGRNSVMNALATVGKGLFAKPEDIVHGCTDSTWKWFKVTIDHLRTSVWIVV